MDKKKLEHFRKKLLELRSQLLNRSHMKSQEHLRISPEDLTDESDHAAAVIQQSLALNVQERDRWMLKEIDHALSKFDDMTYGICEDTEEPIDEARLEAEPFTRYSVEAAELREKKAKRYANFGT